MILPGHGESLGLHPPLVRLQVQRLHAVQHLAVHLPPDDGQEPDERVNNLLLSMGTAQKCALVSGMSGPKATGDWTNVH